jgi:hypothetical protein
VANHIEGHAIFELSREALERELGIKDKRDIKRIEKKVKILKDSHSHEKNHRKRKYLKILNFLENDRIKTFQTEEEKKKSTSPLQP